AILSADGTCNPADQGICRPHIFLMDPDGTNVRQITFDPPDPTHFGGDGHAAISPDGTMVAFISNRNLAADGSYQHGDVYVVNADGSGMTQLTFPAYDPNGNAHGQIGSVAWSPNSTMIAFRGNQYSTFCSPSGNPVEYDVIGVVN